MLTVSKVRNVQRADMRSSQSLAEKYYECRMNDFFSKGNTGKHVPSYGHVTALNHLRFYRFHGILRNAVQANKRDRLLP